LQATLSFTVPPIVALFLVGLFWSRANAAGAFAALVVGLASGGVLFWLVVVEQAFDLHFLYAAPILFAVSVSVLVVVSLATSAEPREDIEELLWTPSSFSNESAQLREQPYWKNYRLWGIVLLVVTALLVAMFW
jgi:SSS family solute:Na+ symporter